MNEIIQLLEKINAKNEKLQSDVKALGIRIKNTNDRINKMFGIK